MTPSLQFSLLRLFFWRTAALIERENDKEENNIISSSSGRYTVKEEVQKAPDTNHFCNLTETSVKISFPEMKSRVFVNFLGYKEPNLINLMRCKGRCGENSNSVACKPLRVREKKMKMTFRSYLTGAHHVPDERLREVVLEEHLECGCQCDRLAALTCSGTFNESTCECECDKEMFEQSKSWCEEEKNFNWNSEKCECEGRSLVARGAGLEPARTGSDNCVEYLRSIVRSQHTLLDIGSWILLGSCLALVAILALTTWHYRKKLRALQKKDKKRPSRRSSEKTENSKGKKFFQDRDSSGEGNCRKMPSLTQLDRIAIENSLLLSSTGGGQLYHEQYDEHGVKIEYQCFK